jgi:L-methionine (R)-S-oxide reductase
MTDNELLDKLKILVAQDGTREARARHIAEAIREAGACRWVGIYDVDLERGFVSNIAWSGPGAPAHQVFPVTCGLTSRAIAGGKTVNVGDVASDSDYLTALGSTRAEMIVPVRSRFGDRVVGTIDVESDRPNAFDSAAQSLIEECGRAIADFWAGSGSTRESK